MRVLRAKSVRKHLRFYRLIFGITEPYNVIVDGNFIFTALKLKIDIRDRLQKLLQVCEGSVKLYVQRSVLKELKEVGASASSAYEFANAFCEVIEDDSVTRNVGPISPSERLIGFLSTSTAANSNASTNGRSVYYFVATQDKELRQSLSQIPGVPAVYLNHVTLVLEPPSSASRQFNQQLESQKGSLNENEEGAVDRVRGISSAGKKRSFNAVSNSSGSSSSDVDVDGRKLMYEKQAVPTASMQIQQARKKHKAQAPNPLSSAKPKENSANAKKKKQNQYKR